MSVILLEGFYFNEVRDDLHIFALLCCCDFSLAPLIIIVSVFQEFTCAGGCIRGHLGSNQTTGRYSHSVFLDSVRSDGEEVNSMAEWSEGQWQIHNQQNLNMDQDQGYEDQGDGEDGDEDEDGDGEGGADLVVVTEQEQEGGRGTTCIGGPNDGMDYGESTLLVTPHLLSIPLPQGIFVPTIDRSID